MIKGIGHIAFYTQNMDKALQFYCDILGFQKAFSLNRADGQPWIQYLLPVSPQAKAQSGTHF